MRCPTLILALHGAGLALPACSPVHRPRALRGSMVEVPPGLVVVRPVERGPWPEAAYPANIPTKAICLTGTLHVAVREVIDAEFKRTMRLVPKSRPGCVGKEDLLVGQHRPVTCVTWYEAIHFANRLSQRQALDVCYTISAKTVTWDRKCDGYRLPTELEWEHLAQGVGPPRTGGPAGRHLCDMANVRDLTSKEQRALPDSVSCRDGWAGLAPVQSLIPNTLGIHDTIGNVAEWVWTPHFSRTVGVDDTQESFVVVKKTDAMAKGGSWQFGPWDTWSRWHLGRDAAIPSVGFRLVRGEPIGQLSGESSWSTCNVSHQGSSRVPEAEAR